MIIHFGSCRILVALERFTSNVAVCCIIKILLSPRKLIHRDIVFLNVRCTIAFSRSECWGIFNAFFLIDSSTFKSELELQGHWNPTSRLQFRFCAVYYIVCLLRRSICLRIDSKSAIMTNVAWYVLRTCLNFMWACLLSAAGSTCTIDMKFSWVQIRYVWQEIFLYTNFRDIEVIFYCDANAFLCFEITGEYRWFEHNVYSTIADLHFWNRVFYWSRAGAEFCPRQRTRTHLY